MTRPPLLFFAALLMLSTTAFAQLIGTDIKPGDSCTAAQEGHVARNASADRDVNEITLICDGSQWLSATGGGGLAALQGQNDTGPCTEEKSGLIRYRESGDPHWEYCHGGTTSWLPFRLPQCQNDDTGACTLAALRSSNDPQFTAANIRCGSQLLGVIGTYGSGSANAFTWADVTGADPATLTTTGTVSISGIPAGCPADVEVSGSGSPQVSIAGGAWGSGGAITNGQTLAVRLTSGAFGTTNTANVFIGSTSDAWSVTTRAANNCSSESKTWLTNCAASVSAANHGANGTASIANPGGCGVAWYGSGTFSCTDGTFNYTSGTCTQQTACDTTPDTFSFTDAANVEHSTLATASAITITGINTGTLVSVSGGGAEVSINGGIWTTSGTIMNGQTLAVRLTSSAAFATAINTAITVGSITDTWSVTTRAGNSCPLPWGGTIAHGASTMAYQVASVACGGSCNSAGRSCSDGVLSNAGYDYASCSVGNCLTWQQGACNQSASTNSCSTNNPSGTECSPNGQTCRGTSSCGSVMVGMQPSLRYYLYTCSN